MHLCAIQPNPAQQVNARATTCRACAQPLRASMSGCRVTLQAWAIKRQRHVHAGNILLTSEEFGILRH